MGKLVSQIQNYLGLDDICLFIVPRRCFQWATNEEFSQERVPDCDDISRIVKIHVSMRHWKECHDSEEFSDLFCMKHGAIQQQRTLDGVEIICSNRGIWDMQEPTFTLKHVSLPHTFLSTIL